MRFLIIVCVLSVCTITADRNLRAVYREWQKKFGREHKGLRNNIDRFRQFQKTAKTIDLINSMQHEWRADFTTFADMTEEEKRMYTGLNTSIEVTAEHESSQILANSRVALKSGERDPEKVYWNMGSVQNQGFCGSCWAFAAVAVMEGKHIKEHGEYREMSEQTILDCALHSSWEDRGCDGYSSLDALKWTHQNRHATKDYSYLAFREDNPYLGYDRKGCPDDDKPHPNALRRARVGGWFAPSETRNDPGLQHALARQGPILVSIYSSWALPLYLTGTYSGTGCGWDPNPNHAVVVAGYEKHYWYVKNSWGSAWGYSGYAYFSRSWHNLCSISKYMKTVDWRVNKNYEMCRDTPERERTACVDDADLSEHECQRRGCCFDGSASNTRKQCFAKGKLTIYDGSGSRRILYGSMAGFSAMNFATTVTSVRAEMGTWLLYGGRDWYSGPVWIVSPRQGEVKMNIQSVRLISTTNVLHLFVNNDFSGNKLTLSAKKDKLEYGFNNAASSFISFGDWTICDGENQTGRCQKAKDHEKRISLCQDCISSVH